MARRKSQAPDSQPQDENESNDVSPVSTPVNFPSEPATPVPAHTTTLKRKRGRPSRAALEERARATPAGDPDDNASDVGTPSSNHLTPSYSVRGKRRGRPSAASKAARNRGGPSHYTSVPLDQDGNPQTVENDEIVLPEDLAGEAKVDLDGNLKGGREYRCRTFTLMNRGDRLYMLSTEPARCIGFRDSYLFFQKHKQLYKIIVDDDEKYDMIARDLIPHSYKGRAIGVVTARSVFREFGARIIVGGRKIIDDYWEQREREKGAVDGQLADPNDKLPEKGQEYNRNQYVAWHGASAVYHTGQASVPTANANQPQPQQRKKKIVVTDTNWMLEHARAASQFNSRLAQNRAPNLGGVYEAHTNLNFYPQILQPEVCKWEMVRDSKSTQGGILVEEQLKPRTWAGKGLGASMQRELCDGFGEWDDALIDSLETEEEKAAARAQVELERKYYEEMYS